MNLGQTTVGTGELNGYAIVNEENFDSDVYMMAKIKYEDTENLNLQQGKIKRCFMINKQQCIFTGKQLYYQQ